MKTNKWFKTGALIYVLGISAVLLLIQSCDQSNFDIQSSESAASIEIQQKPEMQAAGVSNIRKKVMHLNICGNVCWVATHPESGGVDSRGSTSRMSKVLSAIDSYAPHIISFNEICYSQYRAIRADLISRGYGATYASTTTAGNCDNYDASWGQGFGNAIFFKGSSPASSSYFVLPNASGAEPRHLLYVDVPLDGKTVRMCTTHLTTDAAWRRKQIEYIVDKTSSWIEDGKPVIITGDFNAEPTASEMGLMYSHSGGTGRFQECDESHSCTAPLTFCRGGEYTFNEAKKLDYIFFSAVHFGGMEGDAKSRFPNSISDHNTLQGSAYWQ